MVRTLQSFFELNEILLLFIYGQVFFVLGLAVALQSRRHSRLQLADGLGWLALFGVLHGLHEWGYVFIPVQATYTGARFIGFLSVVHVALLAVSFAALFGFGSALLRDRWPGLRLVGPTLLLGWGAWLGLSPLTGGLDEPRLTLAAVVARYLIGLPAGLLAAYGLRYQAEQQIKPLALSRIYAMFRVAGVSLFFYALFTGLLVPPAGFFPARLLNEATPFLLLGLPTPLLRSVAALVLTVAIIRGLEVFELEVDRLIERMEVEQSLAAERERIGRELHDGAIQQAYTAGLIIESARRQVQDQSVVAARLDRALTALNEAIASLRTYMGELRTLPVQLSLLEGLQQQAGDPRLNTVLDVTLDLALPEALGLDPVQTNHVLAIVGEALANAARHSNARSARVQGGLDDGRLLLEVSDDGQGFAVDEIAAGYGLRNMRDRARLLNGELNVDSAPGHGTRVSLTLPLEEL